MAVDATEALWSEAAPDERGLVTAVVQHAVTGQVLMVGMMSKDALAATLATGRVTFWSRSRQVLWEKGETSGHTLALRSIRIDCDGDALLVTAEPAGPTCHTGKPSCFFRASTPDGLAADEGPPAEGPDAVLARLFAVVLARKAGRGATQAEGRSYVRELLASGTTKVEAKLREEADELARALASESRERVAAEAADLVFHTLVGLVARDVDLTEVAAVLAGRHGTSGLDEKAARPAPGPTLRPPRGSSDG
jgi:phosphoribosyl-ATP pyrophosphohydrolase/phosphoribosyl-AMP cyclohydrolase